MTVLCFSTNGKSDKAENDDDADEEDELEELENDRCSLVREDSESYFSSSVGGAILARPGFSILSSHLLQRQLVAGIGYGQE